MYPLILATLLCVGIPWCSNCLLWCCQSCCCCNSICGFLVPALARVSVAAAVPTAADISSAYGVTNVSGFSMLVPLLCWQSFYCCWESCCLYCPALAFVPKNQTFFNYQTIGLRSSDWFFCCQTLNYWTIVLTWENCQTIEYRNPEKIINAKHCWFTHFTINLLQMSSMNSRNKEYWTSMAGNAFNKVFIKSESNLDSELFEVPKHIHEGMEQLFVFEPLFMIYIVYIFTSLLVEYVHYRLQWFRLFLRKLKVRTHRWKKKWNSKTHL